MRKPKIIKKCQGCGGEVRNWRKYCSKKCYGKHKSSKNLIDENTLKQMYLINKKSCIEIANELNFSITTVCKYLRKYKIKYRRYHDDFTGMQIGDTYVIRVIETQPTTGKHAQWLCRCSCGKEFTRLSSALKTCIHHKCVECTRKTTRSTGKPPYYVLGYIKTSAESRDITFSIDIEYLRKLYKKQKGLCALSGVQIDFAETGILHGQGFSTASLDRIDSSTGYIEGNVQWVHKKINVMKMALKQEEFVEYCDLVSKYQRKI